MVSIDSLDQSDDALYKIIILRYSNIIWYVFLEECYGEKEEKEEVS